MRVEDETAIKQMDEESKNEIQQQQQQQLDIRQLPSHELDDSLNLEDLCLEKLMEQAIRNQKHSKTMGSTENKSEMEVNERRHT